MFISSNDDCKKYEQLFHYTNLNALSIILNERTFKCNSLINVNDLLEKKRIGIEEYAGNVFITCFCHFPYEIVPFWFLYGGTDNSQKVMIKLKNFARDMENFLESDYILTDARKKIFFDIHKLFKFNGPGISFGTIDDSTVEKRQTIRDIKMIEVIYKNHDDNVFTQNYCSNVNVSFGEGGPEYLSTVYDPRDLGKHKTINWEYEKETRLRCTLQNQSRDQYFEFLLLRFKEELLRDSIVVANPWSTNDFIERIYQVIADASISEEIKKTIIVQKSTLDGQIVAMG